MSNHFTFSIKSLRFDEHYTPADNTRLTTNFANLARGAHRQENLRKALAMINNRFNDLANWDNPTGDRYALDIDIVSANLNIDGIDQSFPLIEILQTTIIDKKTNQRIDGMTGNSFSSYVRDYDFSVRLLDHNKDQTTFTTPDGYGELHGKLFKHFLNSSAYQENFTKQPVICLSVSSTKQYHRTGNQHPVLGVEYVQNEYSLTDEYFDKMGLKVRYFMPEKSVAPLAFYFAGDLLNDYTNLELISSIATMESFQKIYRPEIYNANSVATQVYQPSLNYQDFSLTLVEYDRVERGQLAVKQGKFTEENFITPFKNILDQWAANYAL